MFDNLPYNVKQYKIFKFISELRIILVIWLLGAINDRIWYSLDNSVPSWDRADYLNGVLNYHNALQNPQWFNSEWWRNFWLLSNKIPPLHYLVTTPFFNWFGIEEDAATLVTLFYSALLLVAIYRLGVLLFNRQVGIYAAIFCQLLPGLYYYRLEFLLDYPLTTVTIFSFWLLTLWKVKGNKTWLLSVALGIALGLAVLLKQTALFFLAIPIVWLFISCCKNRQWLRISQLIISISIGIAICYPWYRTNWLLILTSGKRATVDSAILEGDPALNTLDAWLYYFKTLPYLLSWHLLLVPIVGTILYLVTKTFKFNFYTVSPLPIKEQSNIKWLLIYLVGGYLLSSFNINKDARYILPLLPIIALFLAIGLQAYSKRWRKYISGFAIAFATILMLLNIYLLPGSIVARIFSPRVQHYPYTGQSYPHREVIQEIINSDFYLRTTLGVLPSTPVINQHNFSFYGGRQNFQVVGRQVGIKENEVIADTRSLNWFITKTGDPGSVPPAQKTIDKLITESSNFELHKSWQLPDNSELKLYRARYPNIDVSIIAPQPYTQEKIQLNEIDLPEKSSNGIVPVTYKWIGNGKQLARGIVLLSWQPKDKNSNSYWLHDRAIGMGMLAESLESPQHNHTFQITERTAMLVPEPITPGQYKLQATYLNRQTKESYEIPIPETTITIDADAPSSTTTELDLVSQLRNIAPTMATGIEALEPIFAQTARINQYDGKQDYLKQTELALTHRLQNEPSTTQQKLDWYYAIALSRVLQQDVRGAITTWQKITQLAPDNPYNYAYLAFVYLYNWQPKLANIALERASAIDPNIPEVKTLQGIAALMQGNLIKAWKLLL